MICKRTKYVTESFLVIASLISLNHLVLGIEVSIPMRCRTEGRISLTYPSGSQTFQYHLVFTESLDGPNARSRISIGYVAHEQSKYHTRKDTATISVGPDGACKSIDHPSTFIPELAWFVSEMIPIPLKGYTANAPESVGPTGLLAVVQKIDTTNPNFPFDRATTHRNIPCDIYSHTFPLDKIGISIKVEVYVPTVNLQFRNLKTTYFSVRATATNSSKPKEQDKISFLIDYYNIESMDNDPVGYESLKDDFNLPKSSGCSEYLRAIQPQITADSFSLKYRQATTSSTFLMAYDHAAGLLRKEEIGKSVSIWDLREALLYHIDNEVSDNIRASSGYTGNVQTCSVLEVLDNQLGNRPFEVAGKPIDMLQLIGATNIAYLGRSTVRELPCFIYETILSGPPDIFGMNYMEAFGKNEARKHYIIQYYILQGKESQAELEPKLEVNGFWPAKIVLFRRYPDDNKIEYVDHLDVYDFYWSVGGWDKKSTELFMASECFDDETEQVNVELALTFDRVHQGAAKGQDKSLLSMNKFKLEYDFINDIFSLFDISKMHLTNYELKLKPNHVNLNMIISDRKEERKVVFFGTGLLPDANAYQSNRVVLEDLDEVTCANTASHIVDVSIVFHCQPNAAPLSRPTKTCIVVHSEPEPTMTRIYNQKQDEAYCRAYIFLRNGSPKSGTYQVMQRGASLYRHPFDFEAVAEGGKVDILKGSVRNYDISHELQLITIADYMFVVNKDEDGNTNQQVRSFSSVLDIKSERDCTKICDLDVTCRSYSYCKSGHDDQKCLLSTLDLRISKVQDQLVHSDTSFADGDQVTVTGASDLKYQLATADRCDIHERDYLSMFKQTGETIRLERGITNQFQTTSTTFECAKLSVESEQSTLGHHIAMFAYCANAKSCILDENLFSTKTDVEQTPNDVPGRIEEELVCRIYRKKYQTYFKVSGQVLAQKPDQQVRIELGSVEECARACWMRLGQVCASFDYCSPNSCLVNLVSTDSSSVELETRSGCLHYERDLNLDELRKQHLIGRHEVLVEQEEGLTFGRVILNLIICILVVCAFIYGLVLGRQVNDRMEAVTIFRQSVSAASGVRASQLFGFQAFSSSGEATSGQANEIRMEVLSNSAANVD